MDPQSILLAAVVMALGSAAGYLLGRGIERSRQKKERAAARDDASRIIARANEEADTTLKAAALQGKEEVYRLRESWQSEEARRREEVKTLERRIGQRSDSLDRKFDRLNERESRLEEGKGRWTSGRRRSSGATASWTGESRRSKLPHGRCRVRSSRWPASPPAKPAAS